MRKLKKMPSLSNVTAGAQAVLNLPLGLTYEQLILDYSGVTLAQMMDIEVVINGKTVQHYDSGEQLDALNQYYGRGAAANGKICLYFVRPELDNVITQRLTAIGTADVDTLSVQFDIDSAASAPVVEAYAMQSAQQPLGMITKVKQFPCSFATSGEQDIDNIPRSGARIAAIHLIKNDVNRAEVEANGVIIVEQTKSLAESVQAAAGRVLNAATTGMMHVDFLLDGDINHAMQTAGLNDFRIRPTIATGGQVNVLVEYLDGFAGI